MFLKQSISGLQACGVSSVGKVRGNNEDNFFVNGIYPEPERIADISSPVMLETSANDLDSPFISAVFDGIGGESGGEIASGEAVKAFAKGCAGVHSPEDMIELINCANDAVLYAARERFISRCGTTVAAIFVDNGILYAFNVGDSRIYLLHRKNLILLTRDDTQAQMFLDAKLIKKKEAEKSRIKHILTQYIGMDRSEQSLKIHVRRSARLIPGDRILLCSDGITDAIDEGMMAEVLRGASDAHKASLELIDSALRAGGNDNATALVIETV